MSTTVKQNKRTANAALRQGKHGGEEEWWLQQLARQNLSAIWLRSKYPHNYEITAIEAYMDLYELTGDTKYLAAVDGFYAMFREHWMHVGGTVAIKEWRLYPPDSYFLDTWVSHLLSTIMHSAGL